MSTNIRTTFTLPADLYQLAHDHALIHGYPIATVFRLAIEQFLAKQGVNLESVPPVRWGGHRTKKQEEKDAYDH